MDNAEDGGMEYPKRPPFFSHRFVRLMAKACLANEIGAEACWMLAVIAHTEDASGYRRPVTFFNEQLFPLVGLGSVDALGRCRERAVKAGWLMYIKGAKKRAAKYFVVVPAHLENIDDKPTDEGDYSSAKTRKNVRKNVRKQPRRNRDLSAKKPRGNREESAEHSSLYLSLFRGVETPTPEIISTLFISGFVGRGLDEDEVLKIVRELEACGIPLMTIAEEVMRSDRDHSEWPRVLAKRMREAAKKPKNDAADVLQQMLDRRKES